MEEESHHAANAETIGAAAENQVPEPNVSYLVRGARRGPHVPTHPDSEAIEQEVDALDDGNPAIASAYTYVQQALSASQDFELAVSEKTHLISAWNSMQAELHKQNWLDSESKADLESFIEATINGLEYQIEDKRRISSDPQYLSTDTLPLAKCPWHPFVSNGIHTLLRNESDGDEIATFCSSWASNSEALHSAEQAVDKAVDQLHEQSKLSSVARAEHSSLGDPDWAMRRKGALPSSLFDSSSRLDEVLAEREELERQAAGLKRGAAPLALFCHDAVRPGACATMMAPGKSSLVSATGSLRKVPLFCE